MPKPTTDILEPFKWTKASEMGAVLLAEGGHTRQNVARTCGVHYDTLRAWMQHPDFREKVNQHITDMQKELFQSGLLQKEARLTRLNEDWARLQAIRDSRTAEYHEALANPTDENEWARYPGYETGLLLHKLEAVGNAINQIFVHTYELDKSLMDELRQVEKQAAQEAGQWVEKSDVSHAITRIEVVYEDRPMELLEE